MVQKIFAIKKNINFKGQYSVKDAGSTVNALSFDWPGALPG